MTDLEMTPANELGACAGVVIADDDDAIVTALAALVDAHHGLRVAGTASSGFDAAALAARERPALAVLDVNMPGGSMEGLRAVLDASPGTKVVFHTAQADRRTRRRLLDAGAAAVFAKGEAIDLAAAFHAVLTGERR